MSLPTNQSTTLPAGKQDANIEGTFAARPGAKDTAPAGVRASNDDPASATFADSTNKPQSMGESVKGSLDSLAQQVPSTQSVAEQLPTAQGTADAIKQGASSLLAGISGLAMGATNVTQDNAAETHPESAKARDVDDFHIPGAFEEETTDQEDKEAVKSGLQSAYDSTPSTHDVKNNLPSTQDVKNTLPSTQDVNNTLPSTQSAKPLLPDLPASPTVGTTRSIPESIYGTNRTADTTTNQLAGQVPLESRGVPQVVTDSQKKADVGPEASANRGAIVDKQLMEQELRREVPEEPATSSNTGLNALTGNTNISGAVAGGLASAGAAAAGAATYARNKTHETTGTDPVSVLPESAQRSIDGTSHTSGQNTSSNISGAVSEGLASTGAAAASAATYARQKTHETTGTDPVSVLPESAQRSIDGTSHSGGQATSSTSGSGGVPQVVADSQRQAGVGPEATANPLAVREKKQVEGELQWEVPQEPATGSNSLAGSAGPALSGAAAAAGGAALGAAAYAREKTQQATGTDPATVLPESAQRSIDQRTTAPQSDISSPDRPLHAGAAPGTPRNTVESSAQPDVSYEHRPKTLPQSEIAAREQERGLATGIAPVPAPSSGSDNLAAGRLPSGGLQFPTSSTFNSTPANENTFPRVVDPVLPADAPAPNSLNSPDLHSGVHNGVVGSGSSRPNDVPQGGLQFPHAHDTQHDASSGQISHISSVAYDATSGGVHSGVVGAGARRDQD